MGESFASKHVDNEGNTIVEYDDGDENTYVHNIGTTESDIDKAREGSGTTSGGDESTGNGSRARSYQVYSAEQHILGQFQSGEMSKDEYIFALYALHGDYDAMSLILLNEHKWDIASYIPYFKLMKRARIKDFKALQAKARAISTEMNAFFKSGGKIIPPKKILETYKRLITKILEGAKGVPKKKTSSPTAIIEQTKRLKQINEASNKLN